MYIGLLDVIRASFKQARGRVVPHARSSRGCVFSSLVNTRAFTPGSGHSQRYPTHSLDLLSVVEIVYTTHSRDTHTHSSGENRGLSSRHSSSVRTASSRARHTAQKHANMQCLRGAALPSRACSSSSSSARQQSQRAASPLLLARRAAPPRLGVATRGALLDAAFTAAAEGASPAGARLGVAKPASCRRRRRRRRRQRWSRVLARDRMPCCSSKSLEQTLILSSSSQALALAPPPPPFRRRRRSPP